MPGMLYDVKRIEQETKNLCWWASARMLASYRNKTIQNDVIDQKVKADQKMTGHLSFLVDVGFRVVPKGELPPGPQRTIARSLRQLAAPPKTDVRAFCAQLTQLLKKYGPLLTLISRSGSRSNPDHAIIVYGTDGESQVRRHDPAPRAVPVVAEQLQRQIAYDSPTAMMYIA